MKHPITELRKALQCICIKGNIKNNWFKALKHRRTTSFLGDALPDSQSKLPWNIWRWFEEWYFICGPSPTKMFHTPNYVFCAEVKRFANATDVLSRSGELTAQGTEHCPANLLTRSWVHLHVHTDKKIFMYNTAQQAGHSAMEIYVVLPTHKLAIPVPNKQLEIIRPQ